MFEHQIVFLPLFIYISSFQHLQYFTIFCFMRRNNFICLVLVYSLLVAIITDYMNFDFLMLYILFTFVCSIFVHALS